MRDDPARLEPPIRCTFGARAGIYVRGERLDLDDSLGEVARGSATPDERRILVATKNAYLVLLERG